MINLITGLPGNGKTLYTLSYVKALSEKDSRPVFYSGITDLKLPWTEIDPEKWFECPPGSIIVIDECQRIFRPRTISKDVPEFVSKLETHRHLGVDIFLITQHPMLADSAIRRLAGKHMHVVRSFGTQFATIHEWASVKDNCDKNAGRNDSIKHKWKYDTKAFDYYKSAELHTVKRNIPMRLYFLIAAPILIIGVVWYMVNYTDKQKHRGMTEQQIQAQKSGSLPSGTAPVSDKKSYKDAVEDSKQYVYEHQARIVGLPHTAPKYDEITKPSRAPVPAGCIASKTKCGCWSQQSTPITMSDQMCRDIVKNGYFQDFEPDGKQNKESKKPEIESSKLAQNQLLPAPQQTNQIIVMPNTTRQKSSFGQAGVAGENQSNSIPRAKS